MLRILVTLLLALIFPTADFILPVSLESKNCTPKESIIRISLCNRYVYELNEITDYYNQLWEDLEIAKNVTILCQKISKCFNSSQCEDVQKIGNNYREKCDRVEMKHYQTFTCLGNFYQEIYDKNDSSIKNYDFLSTNMTIKKEAWKYGKTGFTDFVKQNCTKLQQYYLKTQYDKFVILLTEKPVDDENCSSLHEDLVGMQCIPQLSKFWDELDDYSERKREGGEYTKNLSSTCDEVKICIKQSCHFDGPVTQKINQMCESVKNFTYNTFDDCFVHIATNTNPSKYPCVFPYTSQGIKLTNTMEAPEVRLPLFLDDEKCVKEVMEGECGRQAVKTFDEDWKRTRKDTLAIRKEVEE